MERGPDHRGVSEVVGFILVFGMVVTAFTVYQGVVVPDQNRQAEFEHNQRVQGDLQELRNAIVSTGVTGTSQAVSVTLGATYPRRAIASNLGASGGTIRTSELPGDGIRINNVEAIDRETRDYVAGSLGPFDTSAVRYDPVYSFYTDAPVTVYENSLAYNRFDDVDLMVTGQTVIDGRRITLLAVNGSLSAARQDTISISTEAISPASNRIAVRNTTDHSVNVTIPTELPASAWEEVLEEELVANGGYVEAIVEAPGSEAVTLVMRQDVVYELGIAKVGVGDAAVEEPAKYVTAIEGDDVSVPEDGTQRLVVEVRDRYNNPMSNVTLKAASPSQGTVSPLSAQTDTAGRATFVYTAPADVGGAQDVDIVVSFDGDGTANESVTFDLRVLDTDGSGGGGAGGSINPAGSGSIVLQAATIGGQGCANSTCISMTFENTASTDQTLTALRFVFYGVDRQSNNAPPPPGSARQDGHLLVNGGDYNTDVDVQIASGSQETVAMYLYDTEAGSTSYDEVSQGDFLVLAAIIDNGTGSGTYFVAPQ